MKLGTIRQETVSLKEKETLCRLQSNFNKKKERKKSFTLG
jgi:hypothetical protein